MTQWKFAPYYYDMKLRPDRKWIDESWIIETANNPEYKIAQPNGRISYLKRIDAADGRWLRVVIENEETIFNTFFDRGFKRP